MASVYVFRFVLFFHFVLVLSAGYGNGKHHETKCPASFDCGQFRGLRFPFTKPELEHCGFFAIRGCDDPSSNKTIQLEKNGRALLLRKKVLQHHNSIKVFVEDESEHLKSTICEVFHNHATHTPKSPFEIKSNLILFPCDRELPMMNIPDACPDYDHYSDQFHKNPYEDLPPMPQSSPPPECSTLQLPCKDTTSTEDHWFSCAEIDIEVELSLVCEKCILSGGRCLVDEDIKFYCHIGNRHSAVIPATASAAAILGVFVLIIYWFRRTPFLNKITILWNNKSKTHQDFEALFLKSHGSLATKRYSYSEIKKMTNCFKEKLGQGGYGSVFKGKLHDKCPVAVKVLKETKGDGAEFINEVATISKTSHVNIVNLLGFCLEGSKKALVYEFMANGSLEKFIFENEANLLTVNLQLSCEILHQIAVGVARGLEYSHRGCNTCVLFWHLRSIMHGLN